MGLKITLVMEYRYITSVKLQMMSLNYENYK